MAGIKNQNIVVQSTTVLHLIGNAVAKGFGLGETLIIQEGKGAKGYL